MHRTSTLLALALLLPATGALAAPLPGPASAAPPGPWQRIADEDGIVVDRRVVPGVRFYEFRGAGVVAAPLGRVVAVLHEAPRRVDWLTRCSSSWSVAEPAEGEQVSYMRTKAPWPVSDRDVVVVGHTRVDLPAREVRIEFHSLEEPRVPRYGGVVRMPLLVGHWALWPVDGGRATRVEYQVLADPGGALPVWLANLASKLAPLKTLQGLRRQLARPDFARWYAGEVAHIEQLPTYRQLMAAAATVATTATPPR